VTDAPVRWTDEALLAALREAGAPELERVRFKPNRRTIWSVTAGGARLNLHVAFRRAPWAVVRDFAAIAAGAALPARTRPRAFHEAARRVRAWPDLEPEMGRIQATWRPARRGSTGRSSAPRRRFARPGPCSATPEQLRELRQLYLALNFERFGNRLPADLHLRLSSRMRSRLGQAVGDTREGRRRVVEIALNARLMEEGQEAQRLDTLLHEMVHAALWLLRGDMSHGDHWRAWARSVGCNPRACTSRIPSGNGPTPPDSAGVPAPVPPPDPR